MSPKLHHLLRQWLLWVAGCTGIPSPLRAQNEPPVKVPEQEVTFLYFQGVPGTPALKSAGGTIFFHVKVTGTFRTFLYIGSGFCHTLLSTKLRTPRQHASLRFQTLNIPVSCRWYTGIRRKAFLGAGVLPDLIVSEQVRGDLPAVNKGPFSSLGFSKFTLYATLYAGVHFQVKSTPGYVTVWSLQSALHREISGIRLQRTYAGLGVGLFF